MRVTLSPSVYGGKVIIPSSKSELHRYIFLSAVSGKSLPVSFHGSLPDDVKEDIACLKSLGFDIEEKKDSITVLDRKKKDTAEFNIENCAATLRFVLPLIGSLGIKASIRIGGRLKERPVDDFTEQLCRHGMKITRTDSLLSLSGRLHQGEFFVHGDRTSQYISALLMTLPFLDGKSTVKSEGDIQSLPYIEMTENFLKEFGIKVKKENNIFSFGREDLRQCPEAMSADGDYSSAAVFACIGALSEKGVEMTGFKKGKSYQPDRKIKEILGMAGAAVEDTEEGFRVRSGKLKPLFINVSNCIDLAPALCAFASLIPGVSVIEGCIRLRYKESDRIESILKMTESVGVETVFENDRFVIHGREKVKGGVINSFSDHRIAMAASIFSASCTGDVIIDGAECVSKSFPDFFREMGKITRTFVRVITKSGGFL